MPLYWVRNKKGQVAAEVGERGWSVHDQGLSWQLYRLKEEGGIPVSAEEGAKRAWDLDTLLRWLQENGYTVEARSERVSA